MFRTLDRYIVAEVFRPTAIALLVFTFTLELRPLKAVVEPLIQSGASRAEMLGIMAALVPQALGITIPMALLVGLLVGFGRLSADRECVALHACGVSVFRLLRPVAALGLVCWAGSSYAMLVAAPAAMQTFHESTLTILATHAESRVKPRVFTDLFPSRVLYVRDVTAEGWTDVFIADSSDARKPAIYVAARGRMAIDRHARSVSLVLEDGTRHVRPADRADTYEVARFERAVVDVDWTTVFPAGAMAKSYREMGVADLHQAAGDLAAHGTSPAAPLIEIQQRLSIPVACWVFAVLGLALGTSTAATGRLASFVYGIVIIFVYYVILFTGRALALAGHLSPWAAMWSPNLALGTLAVGLLIVRARSRDESGVGVARLATQSGTSFTALTALTSRVNSGWRIGRMQTLDRYIMSMYVKVLALAAVGLAGICYISILTDLGSDLFRSTTTARHLIAYCLFELPRTAYFVIPVSTLIAALVTVGLLTKNSELVVMKACGISLYRAAVPLLVFGVASSALLFGLQEQLLAECNRRAEEVRQMMHGTPEPRSFEPLRRTWLASRTGAIYHYESLDPEHGTLRNLSVFEFHPATWRLKRRTFAATAMNGPAPDVSRDEWLATDGRVWDFSPAADSLSTLAFDRVSLPMEPMDYFKTDWPDADRMTYRELDHYISDLRVSGMNVTPYVVDLYRKLSFPLVTIVVTLIAVPFGVTTGRRGALYGIGAGVVLAFLYWTTLGVFGALGKAGAFSPALAAWGPNVLFAAGAVYLWLTART